MKKKYRIYKKKKLRSIIIIWLLFLNLFSFPQKYTVSGYVIDEDNGETIIGATIVLKGTYKGVITDNNGYFILPGMAAGKQTIEISHLSYDKKEIEIEIISSNILLDEVKLKPNLININEVSIVEIKQKEVGDKEVEISQLELTPKAIQSIPTAQNDIFKAIKYLPGITGGELFSPLYSARGGDPSENMVMLDGVIMYNPYHYISSSGIFNVQTVKKVDLLVGGFGAEYGGRNSSILYITTKDGDRNEMNGEIEPTTTHTKGFIELPTGEKGTMMIAGRYYYDLISRFLMYSNAWFTDFNLSYTYRLNKRNKLTFKTFLSKDNTDESIENMFAYFYGTNEIFDIYRDFNYRSLIKWSSNAVTGILKTILSPNIFLTTQAYGSFHNSNSFTDYEFKFDLDEFGVEGMDNEIGIFYNTTFKSQIRDLCIKSSLNLKIGGMNTFGLGAEYNDYFFKNGANINDFDKGLETREPSQATFFAEDKIKIGTVILRPGIRATNYSYLKNWYYEPRVNLMVPFANDFKIKAAWGKYYQYIVSMNTQDYEVNQMLDYYYPLKDVKPSESIHYIFGIEKGLLANTKVSIDFYYKDMPTTYTFDLNQSEIKLHTFSDKLLQGKGKAYGMEIMWQGSWKKLSGWLSYGYSKSQRSYSSINNGNWYLFDYDRPHSFKTIINWQVTDKVSYSSSFIYMSGLPKTIDATIQSYYDYDPVMNDLYFYTHPVSPTKNNARLPSIIELDIGVKKEIRTGFGAKTVEFFNLKKSYLNVSIANLLFIRRNVIWYFSIPNAKRYIPIGINYFPRVTVGYTLKF